MNRMIQLKQTTPVFLVLLLLCFGVLQAVQAVVPPPDGGYPGFNTAEGTNALKNLTTGVGNAAVGWYSLLSNTDGSYNTGVGAGTLVLNSGDKNTATGAAALLLNTTGANNTANGALALLNNTEGDANTATGESALFSNTTGNFNTATGELALYVNTTGNVNTATGNSALFSNVGDANTANGHQALANNTKGNLNTANGYRALLSNTGGAGNTALGYLAGQFLTNGDDNICIGNDGVTGDAGTIRIGRDFIGATYIAGIFGQTSSGGTGVFINSAGKLGTTTSSRLFKDDIKPMNKASEALFALKPVTFRYKKAIDQQGIPQFGLVAEEVEAVNPDLVVRDKKGNPYSVRYDQVNAMLLNEFLKEHRKNGEQGAMIASQQKQIEALTEGLQKVSAQLELNKLPPQTVKNTD